MSVLNPLKHLVATVLVTAHDLLAGWHVPPESVWPLSVVALVILVRLAVLPLAIPAVRSARAAGRARPALLALGTLPRGAGPEEVRAHLEQRREINRAHGVTSLGMLLPLLQLPVFFALYGVLADIGAGRTGGALTATVIASATSGGILGIGLADRWWPLVGHPPAGRERRRSARRRGRRADVGHPAVRHASELLPARGSDGAGPGDLADCRIRRGPGECHLRACRRRPLLGGEQSGHVAPAGRCRPVAAHPGNGRRLRARIAPGTEPGPGPGWTHERHVDARRVAGRAHAVTVGDLGVVRRPDPVCRGRAGTVQAG